MKIQSLVIDNAQIEVSVGKDDGGREYLFARLPFNGDDYSRHSLHELRVASLIRVREAIDSVIDDLEGAGRA